MVQIEIDIGLLTKTEKRVWVKQTAKRKGHYRKVKEAKKDVGEKDYWWRKEGNTIKTQYGGIKIVFHGTKNSPEFQNTYSDDQFQDAIDTIPEKHRKLIDHVILLPKEDPLGEFGRIYEKSSVIEIFKAKMLHEYGTSFEEQFAHEVGHLVARNVFRMEEPDLEYENIIESEQSISSRAKHSPSEDFAESYSLYLNGFINREEYPLRYEFIHKIIGYYPKKEDGYFKSHLNKMTIEIDLSKLERGTHIGRVKVTRGGKTFWRKQRIGQKEEEKKVDNKIKE